MISCSAPGRARDPRGFTLIELLVVIAIIALLAAILFPVFAKARDKAHQTQCMNNQRQIAVALQTYVQDNNETFPTASEWTQGLKLGNKVFDCPSSSSVGNESRPDYGLNEKIADQKLVHIINPHSAELTVDAEWAKNDTQFTVASYTDKNGFRHSDNKVAVASFADGHVENVKIGSDSKWTFSNCKMGYFSSKYIDFSTFESTDEGRAQAKAALEEIIIPANATTFALYNGLLGGSWKVDLTNNYQFKGNAKKYPVYLMLDFSIDIGSNMRISGVGPSGDQAVYKDAAGDIAAINYFAMANTSAVNFTAGMVRVGDMGDTVDPAKALAERNLGKEMQFPKGDALCSGGKLVLRLANSGDRVKYKNGNDFKFEDAGGSPLKMSPYNLSVDATFTTSKGEVAATNVLVPSDKRTMSTGYLYPTGNLFLNKIWLVY